MWDLTIFPYFVLQFLQIAPLNFTWKIKYLLFVVLFSRLSLVAFPTALPPLVPPEVLLCDVPFAPPPLPTSGFPPPSLFTLDELFFGESWVFDCCWINLRFEGVETGVVLFKSGIVFGVTLKNGEKQEILNDFRRLIKTKILPFFRIAIPKSFGKWIAGDFQLSYL